jgi:hypothetical protein
MPAIPANPGAGVDLSNENRFSCCRPGTGLKVGIPTLQAGIRGHPPGIYRSDVPRNAARKQARRREVETISRLKWVEIGP